MIDYYNLNPKQHHHKLLQSDSLTITQHSDLQNAINNQSIFKVKLISLRNSNINDDTLSLLWTVSHPLMLQQINLSENFSFITDAAIDHVCQGGQLYPHLKRLNLGDNAISDVCVERLANCNSISLEQLKLYGNSDITKHSLYSISKYFYLKNLKVLDLHATSIDDDGLVYYLKSNHCTSLEVLNLSMNWDRVTDITLDALAVSPSCKNLKELLMEDCMVSDRGVGELVDSQNVQKLQVLILNNSINIKESDPRKNQITDQSFQYIAYARKLPNLKVLEVRNTQVTAKGIRVLAASLSSEKIQKLKLSHCPGIKEQAITYLQAIFNYMSVKKLYINSTSISTQHSQNLSKKYPHINIVY